MGMMTSSGLNEIVNSLSGITTRAYSSAQPTFLSAWVLNLFIPSQGGQWIVQGPIMVRERAYIPHILNAFIRRQATNLLQPLAAFLHLQS